MSISVQPQRRAFRLALATVIVCAGAGAAAEEDAARLLARALENLYADDYVQTLELESQAPGIRPFARTLQITRKQSVRPGKALVRFLAPFDIRRTSVLILENDGATDDFYIYLPALELTRRISAAQRADRGGSATDPEDRGPLHPVPDDDAHAANRLLDARPDPELRAHRRDPGSPVQHLEPSGRRRRPRPIPRGGAGRERLERRLMDS